MSTKIKFKDTEFELVENNLDILDAATPFFVKSRKLQAEYLDDIDTSLIKQYENRIEQLSISIKQISALEPTAIYDGEQTNEQKVIELEEKLKEVETEFSENEECNIIKKMKNDIEALMTVQIALDKDIMTKIYKRILKGDISKIDYLDSEYKTFAVKVLGSFFFLLQRNGNGLVS
jgi:hypothetical protein